MTAGQVDDDVVAAAARGEVLGGVVDEVVGSERAQLLEVAAAAHAGHLGPERLRELHGVGADAPGCPIDEHAPARRDAAAVADGLQCRARCDRQRRRLCERERARLRAERRLRHDGVLREASGPDLAVDLVARPEARDAGTHPFDGAGDVPPSHSHPRGAQAGREPDDARLSGDEGPVAEVDGCRMHADEHLVARRFLWAVHLGEAQDGDGGAVAPSARWPSRHRPSASRRVAAVGRSRCRRVQEAGWRTRAHSSAGPGPDTRRGPDRLVTVGPVVVLSD